MAREIEFIESALREVGPYVVAKYSDKSDLYMQSKGDPNDILTEADLEVQRRLVERLSGEFANDHIVGEEGDYQKLPADESGRCWLVDPIDGTQNFVRGLFPAFGVSLAFVNRGKVESGGVMMPITGDLFLAERGAGSFRNGARLRVSEVDSVLLARTEIDFGAIACRRTTLERATRVILSAGHLRCHCAAVVGLCSVATGDADAYVHVDLREWDYAAAMIMVEEAGGCVTRLGGSALRLFDQKDRSVLATNGRVHEEFVGILEGE